MSQKKNCKIKYLCDEVTLNEDNSNFQSTKFFIPLTQESRITFSIKILFKSSATPSTIPSYLPIRILATRQIANGRLSVESKLNFHRILWRERSCENRRLAKRKQFLGRETTPSPRGRLRVEGGTGRRLGASSTSRSLPMGSRIQRCY